MLILFLVIFSFWNMNIFGQLSKKAENDVIVSVNSDDKRVKVICEKGEITEFRFFPNGYENQKVRDNITQVLKEREKNQKSREYIKNNKPLLIGLSPLDSPDAGFAYHYRVVKKMDLLTITIQKSNIIKVDKYLQNSINIKYILYKDEQKNEEILYKVTTMHLLVD